MSRLFIREVSLRQPPEEHSYLRTIPVIRCMMEGQTLRLSAPVTCLVGENGIGKSTLIEGIAVAFGFNAEGGTRNFAFSNAATHSELYSLLAMSKEAYPEDGFFLRAESFYNAISYIDRVEAVDSYGGTSLHNMSHGEGFLTLVQNRFSGNGLYILDEPEAALSPSRLLTLLVEIHRLVEDGSQFIIATHSPMLMAYPGACVLELSEEGARQVDYRDTEHYQITRRFLENPDRMLQLLLADEE